MHACHTQDKSKWMGKGVEKAIHNINAIIAPAVIAKSIDPVNQRELDAFLVALDGTEDKSKLGANAILGVSMAATKAGAAAKGVPLYRHIADLAGNKDVLLPVPVNNLHLHSIALHSHGVTSDLHACTCRRLTRRRSTSSTAGRTRATSWPCRSS